MEMISDLLAFFGLSTALLQNASYINIITGFVTGFFGYKLLKLWKIVCGFGLGCFIGHIAGKGFASETSLWAITLAFGILMAVLAHFIFDLGLFVFGFIMTISMFHIISQTVHFTGVFFYMWTSIGLIASILLGSLVSHFQKFHFLAFTSVRGAISLTAGYAVLEHWNDLLRLIGLCVIVSIAGYAFQSLITKKDD